MGSPRDGYRTLDDLNAEREAIAWYWRFIAQIASWMILGGFLLLPSTYDREPQLRFSTAVNVIIITALLTGGLSLTALLTFACPSVLFRRDAIFLPTASSSIFAFLAALYGLASSDRYAPSATSFPITLGLTAATAGLFGTLAALANRSARKARPTSEMRGVYLPTPSPMPSPSAWDPGYYAAAQYGAHIHPAAQPPGVSTAYDPATAPVWSEDDAVNHQMATLLRGDHATDRTASRSTFRLEWPVGEGDDDVDPLTGRVRARTFSATSAGRWLVPGSAGGQRPGWMRFGRGRTGERDEQGSERRGKSREERRREIEMGQL